MINTAAPLTITMLGEFTIKYKEKILSDHSNRSKKLLSLLEYIIVHRTRSIPQSELIDIIWEDNDSKNPANTLKVLLHRVRMFLLQLDYPESKTLICCKNSMYFWNSKNTPLHVDFEDFELFCKKGLNSESGDDEALSVLLSAIRLYNGQFLPQSSTETWVLPLRAYYHSLFLQAVNKAIDILAEQKNYDELFSVCNKAIAIEPYDESLHTAFMKTLIAMGNSQQALYHYNKVSEMFYNEFGISPSEQFTSMYNEVIKTTKTTELSLNTIVENLKEQEKTEGCFFCEYEVFKSIYRLEARSASRSGQVVYIALLTVLDMDGNIPSGKLLNKFMDKLRQIVFSSLRKSDIFSRYSVNQYLLMLPATNKESVVSIMSRIMKNYRRENPTSPISLQYSVKAITPDDFLE